VRLVAAPEFRVQRLLAEGRVGGGAEGQTEAAARKEMLEVDTNRARYLKQHYGLDWNDATNYHMVLNTGLLGLDGVTELIVARVRKMWPEKPV